MGQSAGGHPDTLARQAGQLHQIHEGGRLVILREQAHAGLGDISQLTRRRASEILRIPHKARLGNCSALVKWAGGYQSRIAGLAHGAHISRLDRWRFRSIDSRVCRVRGVESAPPCGAGPNVVDHPIVRAVGSRVHSAKALRISRVV